MEESKIVVGEVEFPRRNVFFKTYGCQMNEHDSQRMLSHLQSLNFYPTQDQDQADLVIFNTCAIRDNANSKFYSHLGEFKIKKQENKDLKVGIAGCIAQTEGREILAKYPQTDFAFGTDQIDSINDFVYRSYAGDKKFWERKWDRDIDYSIETKIIHDEPRAFVNIMKGCDNYCSYCIVPYTRGREKSRKLSEIVDDVRKMVEYKGIQEITLLGQNVNSFGLKNGESLAQLIMRLEPINGLHLIRYTSSHPKDVSDELIAAHGVSKKLSRHLHLPVQSGSNSVLQRMDREYSVEHYLGLLEKLRKAKSDIVLTTDIICGFPNETEEEHQDTLKLLKDAQYDSIYSFAYSPRAGTKAFKLEDSLSDETRNLRLREVQALQLSIQEKIRQEMVGKSYKILIDGSSEKNGIKKWKGRTNCMRIVHFAPPQEIAHQEMKWHWVDVKITSATRLSCQGDFIYDHGLKLNPNFSNPQVL